MYKTENQFSTTASQLPIEENYTNLDIDPHEVINPQVGYTFRYPQRWLESPSQNKAIGIRRLDIIPTNHVLSLVISVEKPASVTTEDPEDTPDPIIINFEILAQNTLLEILTNLCNYLNNSFARYRFYYQYNDTGDLNISCVYINDILNPINARFRIEDTTLAGTTNLNGFLMFLNQDLSNDDRRDLTSTTNPKIFHNVWNREYIEFHASFSDSKRRFIGIKGDFYEKPNVLYNAPTDGSTFNIRFTTNGKNNIYPKYCRFIIQLVFLYNYRRTVVL